MTFTLFSKGTRFISVLAFMFVPPVHAIGGSTATFDVHGVTKLEYFDKRTKERTGKLEKDTDSLIDEAVLTLDGKFNAFPNVTLVLATEKIRTSEFEPVFVKELVLSHRLETNHTLIAGRMKLPFGFFQTATITDPQTKIIGETKTDTGLGVKGRNDVARLEWNVVAFTDDYRTPEPGADGVTANLSWNATSKWTVGGGIVSNQYARTNSPVLANVHTGMRNGAWGLTGEYVAALDNKGGEKPRGLSIDGTFDLTPRVKLGTRVQTAARRFTADGARLKYNEWALALKYQPYTQTTIGIEYLAGRRHGEPVDSHDVRQITAQVILSF